MCQCKCYNSKWIDKLATSHPKQLSVFETESVNMIDKQTQCIKEEQNFMKRKLKSMVKDIFSEP